MQSRLAGFAMLFALLAGCATPRPHWQDPSLSSISRGSLVKFESREEFDAYLEDLYKAADEYGMWWAYRRANPGAGLMAQAEPPPCDPDDEECAGILEDIVVSGARIQPTSITNNQEIGVDEGDIVKLYKDFLIVLQDGRLFSISIGDSVSELRLVDRIDIYASPDADIWYDELLISENKLIVTGFNYGDDVTDISVFQIDDDGVFEWLSTFEITSGDYYSTENYATRMVDGQLVIYTPLYLADLGIDDGVVFPLYRRRSRDGTAEFWQPLFTATDVHWPIQRSLEPVIHTVSVCPITADDGLECRSFGVIGPRTREWYVSPEAAFLWVSQSTYDIEEYAEMPDCGPNYASAGFEALPSAVYRVPLTGGPVTAVRTQGAPYDQFALDARDDLLHALLVSEPWSCYHDWQYPMPMRLTAIELGSFRQRPEALGSDAYVDLPSIADWHTENRFTENHVVYSDIGIMGPEDTNWETSVLNVVPLDDPQRRDLVPLGHNVGRLELFGDGLIATGYLYRDGLYVSSIGLSDRASLIDSEFLFGFYESEGRSHAFNWNLNDDGSGVFGLPVTTREPRHFGTYSWWAYRDRADLSFFEVGSDLSFSHAGFLESSEPGESDYECVVSCEDWYGNARPIFLDGRVFALSGTELMEGRLINGAIQELGRVQLTGQPDNSR